MSVDYLYESKVLTHATVKSYGQGGELSSTGLVERGEAIHTEAKDAAQQAYGSALRKDAWDDVVRSVLGVVRKYAALGEAIEQVEEAK